MSNQWQSFLVNITKELEQHGDSFLQGNTISQTMHPRSNFQWLASKIYQLLKYNNFDFSDVKESSYGSPHIINHGYSLVTLQSLYNVFLIYHKLKDINSFDHIVDIGGGYGNLCKTCFDLGFEGTYTIYDFPEIIALQQKYLQHTYPSKDVQYKQLQDGWDVDDNSLLIATYSMSEMPVDDREIISDNLSKFQSIFIMYQKQFGNFNNKQYFDKMISDHPEFEFQSEFCSFRKSKVTILSGEKK